MDQPKKGASANEWLVYGDVLERAGNPLGELIALNGAVRSGGGGAEGLRDAYVHANWDHLFGDFNGEVDVEWGWLADMVSLRVRPGSDGQAQAKALLASPIGQSMVGLKLLGVWDLEDPRLPAFVDMTGAIEQISAHWPPNCVKLALVDERAARSTRMVSDDGSPNRNLVTFAKLDLLSRLDSLESFSVCVANPHHLDWTTLWFPSLKRFRLDALIWQLRYASLPSSLARTLANAYWPKLETLELRLTQYWECDHPIREGAYLERPGRHDFSDEDYTARDFPIDWSQELGPLFSALEHTRLARLSLRSFHPWRLPGSSVV